MPAGTSNSKTATDPFDCSPSSRNRIANCPTLISSRVPVVIVCSSSLRRGGHLGYRYSVVPKPFRRGPARPAPAASASSETAERTRVGADHRGDDEVDTVGAGAGERRSRRAWHVALAHVAVPRRERPAVEPDDEIDHVTAPVVRGVAGMGWFERM